jgi:hypothetical protein
MMKANNTNQDNTLLIILIVLAILVFSSSKGCDLQSLDWDALKILNIVRDTTKPLVILLYEGKNGSLPDYAFGAANDLVGEGYDVRMVDDDVVDGEGNVPKWLAPALEQGRALMGGQTDSEQKDYAIILMRNGKVYKASKLPKTREEVVKFVKSS